MLREGGLIRERRDEAGHNWFQAEPASPVFEELKAIVSKLASRSQGGETILVVEDQPATAQITRILLESWGYHVLEAHGGIEAIAIFEQNGDTIHLLLTDIIMPGVNGIELARELVRRSPRLRVVYMSGYPSEEWKGDGAAFLAKPFNPASLSKAIRKELDRTGPRHMNLS